MAGLSSFSDLLGYTSIVCWLGAQFPQLLENIRRQSCEGLALPFLANWFLGDLSNLIGCILTHQLPFQTWLATYFVFVDSMLVIQYIYYSRNAKPTPPMSGRLRAGSTTIRRMSVDRGTPRYRTLSAVAANVAAAAALAAQQDEQAGARYSHSRWQTADGDRTREVSSSRMSRDTDDMDESALTALADSFHSEGGRDGRRKRVSWSVERLGGRGGSIGRNPQHSRTSIFSSVPLTTAETSGDYVDTLTRGRPLQRDGDQITEEPESPTLNRRSSRASRRGAGMVFLGVWALFGFGTLAGNNRFLVGQGTNLGRVISGRDFSSLPVAGSFLTVSSPIPSVAPPTNIMFIDDNDDRPPPKSPHDPELPEEPSTERVLGRIFAWLCTTLYLTSRLPQIWKNFVRKSVEGLSMYLFIFAFLGNVFYVSSILSSPQVYLPPPISTNFIRESIPYLLGSGGTLMFDITIVTQSFIYRPKPRRQGSTRTRMVEEEETGLLSADALAHHQFDPNETIGHSRGRTGRTQSSTLNAP